MPNQHRKKRPSKRARGEKLTTPEAIDVFAIWIEEGKSTSKTAWRAGLSEEAVSRMANHGRKSIGLPSFHDLHKTMTEKYGVLLTDGAVRLALERFRWSEKEAIADTLQTCKLFRRHLRDSIRTGKIMPANVDEAVKLAEAILKLERKVVPLAEQYDLIDTEKQTEKKQEKKTSQMETKSTEELEKIIQFNTGTKK